MAQPMQHSVASATLADLLERILDKGIVIAGDIKIKLVEVELLTIQIRLVVCSVEKAKELGLDWWSRERIAAAPEDGGALSEPFQHMEERIARLEHELAQRSHSRS